MTVCLRESCWRPGPDAWLIAYDIADPRRLGRIHAFLKRHAMPVQYSVFLGWFTDNQLRHVLEGLKARMKCSRDDIRCYRLPTEVPLGILGKGWLPSGADLLGQELPDAESASMCAAGSGDGGWQVV